MMLTPTPNSRRPRPPGSSRRAPLRDSTSKTSNNLSDTAPPLTSSSSFESCSSSSTSSFPPDTPLQVHVLKRQELARSKLARISASPDSRMLEPVEQEIDDVSLDLDPDVSRSPLETSLDIETLPPPYAPEVLRKASTQSLRDKAGVTRSPLKGDDVDVMRDKIQAMKRIIKQRSLDVLVTAEIATQLLHEHNHAISSPVSSSQTPSSSPSPPRALRTSSRSHRGLPVSQSRIFAIQAEADERVADLEAALADARSSEEAQRKAAARLRKDLDKLRRELDRADADRVEEAVAASRPLGIGTPRPLPHRPERQRHRPQLSFDWAGSSFPVLNVTSDVDEVDEADEEVMEDSNEAGVTEVEELEDEVLGDTTVDDVVNAMDEVTERLARMSMESIRSTVSQILGVGKPRLRRPVSTSTFITTSPAAPGPTAAARPLTPRVSIAPTTPTSKRSAGSESSGKSSTRYRRSPWPKSLSVFASTSALSPSPSHDLLSSSVPSPSPSRVGKGASRSVTPFSALNDKMATMRAFVVDSLRMGRSLGSELGEIDDEVGDYTSLLSDTLRGSPPSTAADSVLRALSQPRPQLHISTEPTDSDPSTLVEHEAYSSDEREHEHETDHDDDAHIFYSPAPIPPMVSAALSSLALALAPPTPVFNALSPLRPLPRLRWPASSPSATLARKASGKVGAQWGLDDHQRDEDDEWIDCPELDQDPLARHLRLRPLILASRAAVAGGAYPLPLALTSTIALAHRRGSSLTPTPTTYASTPIATSPSLSTTPVPERTPRTVPGKVVHDLICLLLISLEYSEWVLILLYRLFLDLRHGPRMMDLRRQTRQTRYYLRPA